MAHQPLKRSNVFPGASVSDADWEDVLLRALFETWGVDLAPYANLELSCSGIGSRLDDSGSYLVIEVGGYVREGSEVDLDGA